MNEITENDLFPNFDEWVKLTQKFVLALETLASIQEEMRQAGIEVEFDVVVKDVK